MSWLPISKLHFCSLLNVGCQNYGLGCIGTELLLSAQWEERRTILGWKCTFCFWLSHYWTSSYSKDLLGETVTAMSLLHEHLIFALKRWNLKDLFSPEELWKQEVSTNEIKDFKSCQRKGLMTLTGSSNPLYATSAQARFWEGKRAFFGGWEKGWLRRKGTKEIIKSAFLSENLKKNGVMISYHFFQSFSRLSKRHQLLTKVDVFPSTAKFAFKTCRISGGNLRGRTGHINFPCVVDFSRFIPLWEGHTYVMRNGPYFPCSTFQTVLVE